MTATAEERFVAMMLRLRGHGIKETALLKAVEETPHEKFVPAQFRGETWNDCHLPIECGQTMTPPDLVIRIIDVMQLWPNQSVLEIGTGTGFQTALMARMVKKVRSLERYRTLRDAAAARLKELKIVNAILEVADGRLVDGGPDGTYDRIVVNGAFSEQPRQYLDKLSPGGMVFTALGDKGGSQMFVRLSRVGNRYERENLFPIRFQHLQNGVAEAL